MKTIKFLFLLIIIGLLALLIYQNIDYFTTAKALTLDLKFNQWQWASPALPNWAFWGMCFGLGLVITGIKGLVTAYGLGREIKNKDARIAELKTRNTELKNKLDVFIHDPYIKNAISDTDPGEKNPVPADRSDKHDHQNASQTQADGANASGSQTVKTEKDGTKTTGSQMVETHADGAEVPETETFETSETEKTDSKTARN
ncbi:MAG: hypothetical protein ABR534_02040 [Desulfotignum sp.]|nr:hypothetical protein [Desulfobacteraceae bacterium]